MPSQIVKPRSLFGEILRRELDAQHISVRELARRVAETPERVESVRRTLIRYLNGEVSPGEEAREAIAEALSIDAEVFAEEALMSERRARLLNAMSPLADVLLEVAVEIAREQEQR